MEQIAKGASHYHDAWHPGALFKNPPGRVAAGTYVAAAASVIPPDIRVMATTEQITPTVQTVAGPEALILRPLRPAPPPPD